MPANLTRLPWPGEEIRGLSVDLAGPSTSSLAPVLFVPSLGLGADWCFYPLAIERLAEDRPVLLPRPAAQDRMLAWHDGLLALLRALGDGKGPVGYAWHGKVGLVGHGFGATLALLLAAKASNVGAVAAWSAFGSFERIAAEDPSQRDELTARADELSLARAAGAIGCPVVLVHGEEDRVAPFAESEQLFHGIAKDRASLVMLEKTGHSIGARHPFDGSNKELDRAIWIAREFLRREL